MTAMYEIYLCDLSPIGECPFAVANCAYCKNLTSDTPEVILVPASPVSDQTFEDFTLEEE